MGLFVESGTGILGLTGWCHESDCSNQLEVSLSYRISNLDSFKTFFLGSVSRLLPQSDPDQFLLFFEKKTQVLYKFSDMHDVLFTLQF